LGLKFDTNTIIYIGVVAALAVSALFLKNSKSYIFKGVVRLLLGGTIIYIFNLAGSLIGINIPLNPITALITGFLEIPGFALIIIMRYAIYP
jgi:inhibitor of the pro-sigma K processing machinery